MKGYRTIFMLGLLQAFDSAYGMFLQDATSLGLSHQLFVMIQILVTFILVYLRFVTTTPIGQNEQIIPIVTSSNSINSHGGNQQLSSDVGSIPTTDGNNAH